MSQRIIRLDSQNPLEATERGREVADVQVGHPKVAERAQVIRVLGDELFKGDRGLLTLPVRRHALPTRNSALT
jgi:hypothetical protein